MDKLSGGQQQKIQLAVTIMNEPELLILGLDQAGV
ncbi:ABC-type Mn2+/Zn2+ transport system ATPase subunit [Arthrobacter sp. PL16]|nr:ABC-type Mn2+/Zn2+ transport system ATPase subunit [Arthrobacter sp. PL16]